MNIRCDKILGNLLYIKKDDEDAMTALPEFLDKRLVKPPGYIVHVDNTSFIAETTVVEIKAFFEEQGLGNNSLLLQQGVITYYTKDPVSGGAVSRWWPMIYIDASTDYPKEVIERLTQKLSALLDSALL